jgi:hypothetical protein
MSHNASLLVRSLTFCWSACTVCRIKTAGFPIITIWKCLIDIETEEFRHYFVQVPRSGQVILGHYFEYGWMDGIVGTNASFCKTFNDVANWRLTLFISFKCR